jgi:hypothetical protein
MSTTLALAIVSSALQLVGYGIYNRAIWTGRVRPNLSSWLIWGGISLLNTASYFSLSRHDFIVSLMPFTVTAVNVLTLFVILRKGTFQRIGRPDAAALVISAVAVVLWKLTDSSLANLMIQIAIIVGTVPTILGVWRDPSVERPLPWFLWSLSFVCAIVVVTMRHVSWVAYASPVIQMVMYIAIGMLARRSVHKVERLTM